MGQIAAGENKGKGQVGNQAFSSMFSILEEEEAQKEEVVDIHKLKHLVRSIPGLNRPPRSPLKKKGVSIAIGSKQRSNLQGKAQAQYREKLVKPNRLSLREIQDSQAR